MLPLSISCHNPSQEEKKKKEGKEYVFLNFNKTSNLSLEYQDIFLFYLS